MLDKLIAEVQEEAADSRYQAILDNEKDPKLIIGLGRTVLKHFSIMIRWMAISFP